MLFVASVPFWFLTGKYALENSSIFFRASIDIFKYLSLSLKARTCGN